MEKIDLSTNSKKLQAAYDGVMKDDCLTTYAVFAVTKNGMTDVSGSGSGTLDEFVEEFSEGQVQFGFARVTVPGSDVYKNILLGWCPDNAPLKLRTLFATNFADVARVFPGYHVQITARDVEDLNPEEFLARVGAAAGARYTHHATNNATAPKKPGNSILASARPLSATNAGSIGASTGSSDVKPSASGTISPSKLDNVVQPSFGAKPSFGSKLPVAAKPAFKPFPKSKPEDDGWGSEKEIEERDLLQQPLEEVPSAYKPTKVNIEELRNQKSDTVSSKPMPHNLDSKDTQKLHRSEVPIEPLKDRFKNFQEHHEGRLSSLPKPKISNRVASRYKPSDVKLPSFGSGASYGTPSAKKETPEGVFQIHGNENGLTPAQVWAQKRGKYKVESLDEAPVSETAALSLNAEGKPEEVEGYEETNVQGASVKHQVAIPQRGLPPRNAQPVPSRNEVISELKYEKEVEQTAAPLPPVLPSRDDPALPSGEKKKSSTAKNAIAQYDYEKDEDNEVDFVEGDLIIEIDFVDEEWWSGKVSRTGEIGVFPASYVLLEEADLKPVEENEGRDVKGAAENPSQGQTATAEYDYDREEDNEISFKEGDIIVEIDFIDLDWWSGKHADTGEVGVFPGNYVKLH